MQHATLPADELAKELDVIRREMDMGQDDPGRRASRRLFETAYTRSPYRFTVIGYPDIFDELKPADIRGYYAEKYAPNNVFYVVVGDVKNGRSHRANPQRLRKNQGPGDPARGVAGRTEANGAAGNHRGGAHRTRPFSFCLAHSRIAASRHAGARRARRFARLRPQFAPLPAGPRKDRAWCITLTRGPTAPAIRVCSA